MDWTLIRFDEDLWEWHGVEIERLPHQWLLRAFRTQLTQGDRPDWSVSVSLYGHRSHMPLLWERITFCEASEVEVQRAIIRWGEDGIQSPMSMLKDSLSSGC